MLRGRSNRSKTIRSGLYPHLYTLFISRIVSSKPYEYLWIKLVRSQIGGARPRQLEPYDNIVQTH